MWKCQKRCNLHDLFTVVLVCRGVHVARTCYIWCCLTQLFHPSHLTLPPFFPVDDTRVKLLDEENDYINANHVTVRTLFKSESMAASCLSRTQFVPHRLTASENRMPTLNLTL